MTIALFHLALASLALLGAAAASAFVLARWRARPSAGYRLVMAVLAGTLVLCPAQVVLERSGLALDVPGPAPLWPSAAPPARVLAEPADASVLFDAAEMEPSTQEVPATPPELGRPVLEPQRSTADVAREAPGGVASLLVTVWAAGVACFLVRTVRRVLAARAILARSRAAVEAELACAWDETARAWPSARGVELRTSAELAAPACFGFFRQAILLPHQVQHLLEPDCLGHVLLHELIHLERRDAWSMCLAELVRALFWFHPAAWWLFRRAEELRELSCDALVVERAGRPRIYARGLVACAERMRQRRELSLTAALPSWSGSGSQFSRRIEMLLHASSLPKSVSWPTKFLIGACFALCGGAQLALAASAPQEPVPKGELRVRAAQGRSAPAPESRRIEQAAPEAREPLSPEGEDYARRQDPAPSAAQGHGDRIARATELVERVLARNPDDADLRDALELLRQAREESSGYAVPQADWESWMKGYRELHADFVKRFAAEADRNARRILDQSTLDPATGQAQQLMDEARPALEQARQLLERARQPYPDSERRLMVKQRDHLDRSRTRSEPRVNGSEDFDAELRDAMRRLDERQADLDTLRDRIEELRARARSSENAPEAEPRQR